MKPSTFESTDPPPPPPMIPDLFFGPDHGEAGGGKIADRNIV